MFINNFLKKLTNIYNILLNINIYKNFFILHLQYFTIFCTLQFNYSTISHIYQQICNVYFTYNIYKVIV